MIKENVKMLFPPATIGIVGGGQLGRMFVFEAKRMGYHVIVLDPKANSPAGQVADEQIVAGFNDEWAYRELAKKTDVVTFEFEHINVDILSTIENEGYRVIPSSKVLKIIQNKYNQKSMLKAIGVKVPDLSMVNSLDDLTEKFNQFDQKAILKTCANGYDGKGNIALKHVDELAAAYEFFGEQAFFIEEWVEFAKEVSIVVVSDASGIYYYPVVENFHHKSILIKSLIPAVISNEMTDKIHAMSHQIVEALNDYGVYCIEYFVDQCGEITVNEIAPRPHNSGHYTIECCVVSQFEQQVRVVCGMPIGSTKLRMPCAMYNILGNESVDGKYRVNGLDLLLGIPDCHFHLYGKPETSHLKKIGHITVFGETVDIADQRGDEALKSINVIPFNNEEGEKTI